MREPELSELELADMQIGMLQARVHTLSVALRGAIVAMHAEQSVVHPSNRQQRASLIASLQEALGEQRKAGSDA